MSSVNLLRQPDGGRPDLEALRTAVDVGAFFNAAIDLAADMARRTGELVTSSWAVHPGRNEGILRGLAVRVVKWLDRLVAASVEDNGEAQLVFERFTLESLINLAYLLQGPEDRFEAFVWDGMTTARTRRDTIRKHVKARGVATPIEERQLDAIEREATLAGCDLDRPVSQWPRLPPVEQRIKSVLDVGSLVYDFGYRIGSVGVHGTWKDLMGRHVTSDGRYEPILEWREADPTPLLAATVLGGTILGSYAQHLGYPILASDLSSLARDSAEVNRLYHPLYESSRGGRSE